MDLLVRDRSQLSRPPGGLVPGPHLDRVVTTPSPLGAWFAEHRARVGRAGMPGGAATVVDVRLLGAAVAAAGVGVLPRYLDAGGARLPVSVVGGDEVDVLVRVVTAEGQVLVAGWLTVGLPADVALLYVTLREVGYAPAEARVAAWAVCAEVA